MPWEISSKKIYEHMADAFKIVTSGLLNSIVRSNGGIPRSSCQVLAILIGYVLTLAVLVALGQSKINEIDLIRVAF